MPTFYLTEEYSFVCPDSKDMLLVQISERRGKDGTAPSSARKERIPLVKIDEVVMYGGTAGDLQGRPYGGGGLPT